MLRDTAVKWGHGGAIGIFLLGETFLSMFPFIFTIIYFQMSFWYILFIFAPIILFLTSAYFEDTSSKHLVNI